MSTHTATINWLVEERIVAINPKNKINPFAEAIAKKILRQKHEAVSYAISDWESALVETVKGYIENAIDNLTD